MPNLNGANCVRQVPSFTYKQVQALERLHRLDPEDQIEVLRAHGSWSLELASLNKAYIGDVMYTLSTGQYEVNVNIDQFEQLLLDMSGHWREIDASLYQEIQKILMAYRDYKSESEGLGSS
ncbi:hypothetical protein Goe27_02090 [Bacillus phage vB_BsuM-Goe27]|nr:hypothetical protein Goe24_02040 [Bacillus phage vB_BsuM-Goe24]WCS70087.1 hypothetical protein Goe27_02090 [Bacillus phage vB_BsuM-Goe27]